MRRKYERHGHKPANGISPEYTVWNSIRARCNNPKNPNYERYGGRGIKICDRWDKSFMAFLQDMGARPSMAHSIERIDNDGHYNPGNCRWATYKEQARNRRSSRFLTYSGKTATLAEWSEITGVSIGTLHARLKTGWPLSRALSEPVHRRGPDRDAVVAEKDRLKKELP